MIKLNDYLYAGDTLIEILHYYYRDLHASAIAQQNTVDIAHCNFLLQITGLLEHNDFLTAQSQRMRELYRYIAAVYPYLAFTFKGRIKSLIRAESKFNGRIVEYVKDYYQSEGTFPTDASLHSRLNHFRDLIAYRIVISMPRCHNRSDQERKEEELRILYEIANMIPEFLEGRGFTAEDCGMKQKKQSPWMKESVSSYYRDYVCNPTPTGYQSLHVTLYDNMAHCYVEVQLRTKEMDDYAEIGSANHFGYEQIQRRQRSSDAGIPSGKCIYYDEALERERALLELDLSRVDVNMFTAVNNHLINDSCGLYRGRLILPYEHLSRYQSDSDD